MKTQMEAESSAVESREYFLFYKDLFKRQAAMAAEENKLIQYYDKTLHGDD
jgi:hypothetical protein